MIIIYNWLVRRYFLIKYLYWLFKKNTHTHSLHVFIVLRICILNVVKLKKKNYWKTSVWRAVFFCLNGNAELTNIILYYIVLKRSDRVIYYFSTYSREIVNNYHVKITTKSTIDTVVSFFWKFILRLCNTFTHRIL